MLLHVGFSGLSVVGRDRFGVFPLKGKVLNVREASSKAINNNEEIAALKQILGLKQGVEVVCSDNQSISWCDKL